MINHMTEETKKINFLNLSDRVKKNKNLFLGVFIFLFCGGYFLFFTSKTWLQTDSDLIKATALQKTQPFQERDITVGRWDYSEKQNMMEIELDILNRSVDGIDTYKYNAIERTKGNLKVEAVVNEPDFVILRIYDVPVKWREISIHIQLDDNSEVMKIYTNKNAVTRLDKINDMTETEYRIAKVEGTISKYEKEIDSLQKEQEEIQEKIDQLNLNIRQLTESKEYQTDKEQIETDQLISQSGTEIESAEKQLEDNNAEIEEYRERINNAKLQIQDLKKE